MSESRTPTVVLVHGAFADASGYANIIRELESSGVTAFAPANPLRGLTTDAEYLAAFVSAIDGPVVLVGHSYGGAVISHASTRLSNVVGLVYLAAFGLDAGESCIALGQQFPDTKQNLYARPTPYPAGAGTTDGPELAIDREHFREAFCADVPVHVADVMAVSQRNVAVAALSEACGEPGWKVHPSWYLVASDDQMIHPDAQRFMADRMKATTASVEGSHVAFIARPTATADFIQSALASF